WFSKLQRPCRRPRQLSRGVRLLTRSLGCCLGTRWRVIGRQPSRARRWKAWGVEMHTPKCDLCGEPATVHHTVSEAGVVGSWHSCQDHVAANSPNGIRLDPVCAGLQRQLEQFQRSAPIVMLVGFALLGTGVALLDKVGGITGFMAVMYGAVGGMIGC